jgi:tetratricopeptide (TPR) repeat protein
VYSYRSFADSGSYQDESATSLLWAYPEKILQVAERYLQAGDSAGALHLGEKARTVLPAYWRTYQFLATLYSRLGRAEDSARVVEAGLGTLAHHRKVNPWNVLYTQSYAFVLETAGRPEEGLDVLWEAFLEHPKEELIFLTLARFAMNARDSERITRTAEIWLEAHPSDDRARQLLGYVPPPVLPFSPPPESTP